MSNVNPDVLYIAYGNMILVTNFNNFPIVNHTYSFNDDEINSLILNPDENYLAACDDSGQIKMVDLSGKRLYKTLRKHTNICTSVCFIPHRKKELLSGGCDNKLIRWDYTRNKAFCIIDMKDFGVSNTDVNSYLVSPPFIHCLDITSSGNLIACGTENALVQLFDCVGGKTTFRCTLKAHSQGVAKVHFTCFTGDQVPLLLSAGNDGFIYGWDPENCHCRHTTNGTASPKPEESQDNFPESTFVINHGEKINWICTIVHPEDNQRLIVVADNTHSVTLYPIPTM